MESLFAVGIAVRLHGLKEALTVRLSETGSASGLLIPKREMGRYLSEGILPLCLTEHDFKKTLSNGSGK